MKNKFINGIFICFVSITIISCEKNKFEINSNKNNINETMIELGKKLDDPYAIENMQKAYSILKAENEDFPNISIEANKIYVRFLPKNEKEWAILKSDTTLILYDFPLDYEVINNGTYYHDPNLPNNSITWQYTVVPINYNFPDIKYEEIYKVFIPENENSHYKCSRDFLNLLEYTSVKLTGNLKQSDNLKSENGLLPDEWTPKGKIQVYDDLKGWIPLIGANVHVRYLTRIKNHITNDYGIFDFGDDKFRYEANYSIKWERDDYDIRSNTWGQAWYNADGRSNDDWNLNIDKGGMSWCYAHMHRAAYQYYYKNSTWGIKSPPRQALLGQKLHLGGMDSEGRSHYYDFNKFILAAQIKIYCKSSYSGSWYSSQSIFATTIHELAHASHWAIGYSTAQYIVDYIFRKAVIPESWATCVESEISTVIYKGYINGKWNDLQNSKISDVEDGYTPLFIDLIDNNNQREFYQILGNSEYLKYPIDRVSGYSLAQLENVLDKTYIDLHLLPLDDLWQTTFESLAMNMYQINLKNIYSNPTEGYIEELFNNYKF